MGAARLSCMSWNLARYERRNIDWLLEVRWRLEVRCSVKRGFFVKIDET